MSTWAQIEALFFAACERPAAERADFVAACGDAEVAAEVMALLAAEADAGGTLGEIVGGELAELAGQSVHSGRRLGVYRLGTPIGEGGMSVVYAAERDDAEFRHAVAIKILKQTFGSPEATARFRAERQILASLEHPNIVRLLDGGTTDDDLPYLVMERIQGVPITRYVTDHALAIDARVRLVRDVCAAVQFAHAARVIHRDLKPSNILVDASGTPKLLDFGIAKLVDDDGTARTRGALLTPEYASPEQARGDAVTIATDIYSLGAVLYEILVGQPPHVGTALAILGKLATDEPVRPRALGIAADLDNIVMMALHKEPAQRYASVEALDDDLGRYLAHLPVRARRPTLGYRIARFARRHRGKLAVAAAAVTAAVAITIVAARSTAPTDTCGGDPSTEYWNPTVRATIAPRFTKPVDVRLWSYASRQLDALARGWSAQWTAACHADRTADPLLYGQRIACLDGALLNLRGITDALEHGEEPTTAAKRIGGTSMLTDCANLAVLRAQVPPPPPALRDRVVALQLDSYRHVTAGWRAFGQRDLPAIDREAVALATIANALEALDPPSASGTLLARFDLLEQAAFDMDLHRLPAVREAIADAIRRTEASRDDAALAAADVQLAALGVEPVPLENAGELIARAEVAVNRAGQPVVTTIQLLATRANLALVGARFGDAERFAREARSLVAANDLDLMFEPEGVQQTLISALALDERTAEAEAEARTWLARDAGTQPSLVAVHFMLSFTLARAGDLAGALAEHRLADAGFKQELDPSAARDVWNPIYELDLALQIGAAPPDTAAMIAAVAGHGTTPPRQNPDSAATLRRAGLFAAYVYAVEHGTEADHAATLAYERGDLATATRLAADAVKTCAACATTIVWSRWLVALADRDHVDAALAALEAAYQGDPAAVANSGIVLGNLERWPEARAKLEAARTAGTWEWQADVVELDGWLGLARAATGDRDGARSAFEEALRVISILHNGSDGFSYMTPVAELALAGLLPDAERRRARGLAARARDGFARLGPLREARRQDAIRWLAEHP